MATCYAIKLVHPDPEVMGQDGYVGLLAKHDAAAAAQTLKWIADNPGSQARVYVEWLRDSDGQRGYLNPEGASNTGRAWNDRRLGPKPQRKGRPAKAVMPCGWCRRPMAVTSIYLHAASCPARP